MPTLSKDLTSYLGLVFTDPRLVGRSLMAAPVFDPTSASCAALTTARPTSISPANLIITVKLIDWTHRWSPRQADHPGLT